jgi:steroid 5-alpha reductase family enzyme
MSADMSAGMTTYQFAIVFIAISVALAALMSVAWLVWRATRNSGWVDTIWTFGLGTVGIVAALTPSLLLGELTARAAVVAILIALWSARLGLHIAQRSAGISDDPRYAKLLRDWGANAAQQMFWLLQKQALVSIPLALAMALAAFNPLPGLRLQDWLGVVVLLVGIGGEAIADFQLRRFRAAPANKNRICDAGLWGWSRHPNYFFEWFGWLAYPLFAIDIGGAHAWSYPWGFVALAGPLCMYLLLVHVSGIPPLEAHMLERRRDDFRAYQARTNAFFPAPPRTV